MKYSSDSNLNDAAPTHKIRLRGPCKLSWLRNGTQQAEVRVHIPCEISADLFELGSDSEGDSFVLSRNFGLPTGLDDSQRVTLELSGFSGAKRVVVNRGGDAELVLDKDGKDVSFDVTKSLRLQNCFEVEFGSLPAVAGDVQLVIR